MPDPSSKRTIVFFFKAILISAIVIFCIVAVFPESRFSVAVRRVFEGPFPDEWRTVYEEQGTRITVLFGPSHPDDPDSLDKRLVNFISSAERDIRTAIYSFNLDNVADAMISAVEKGVSVRIVYDASNESVQILRCISAGIPVRSRPKGGDIMHNKFVVVDGEKVWTGSMNLTKNGAFRNDNNVLIIESEKIAQNFMAEFDEMFEGKFGARSPKNTAYPRTFINGTEIITRFSPEDGVEEVILSEIRSAKREVVFMAFSFTSRPISEAMVDRMTGGVSVRGVFERSQQSRYSRYNYLNDAGADVRLDSNPYSMHHKVIVIDRNVVITGSYNFSNKAEKGNDENCLIIRNPDIAEKYLREFNRIWN